MDPRNSAKVTAPDLLEAFHESAPRQDTESGSDVHIYIVFFKNEETEALSILPLNELERALEEIGLWVSHGDGYGSVIIIGKEPNALFTDAQQALSAPPG